jgi:NRAMP (natural resistance-associated macrophage protein)-like metal ion transporter
MAKKKSSKRSKSNPFKFLATLGPGLITGASDDDPSGIGTYSVAGASLGFATLWTALITFPLQVAIQLSCAKIAMVTGRELAGVLHKHYSRWLLYPVVVSLTVANIITAGADIGAIAAAINLAVPIPALAMIVPISAIILSFQLWGSYSLIEKIFKWLTLSLLAYIATAFFVAAPANEILSGTFFPKISFDSKYLATLMAIFGTTITPYMFFWQSSQELEEEKKQGRKRIADRQGTNMQAIKRRGWDVTIGMFMSNLVMYFIIFATAATLFKAGKTNIQSATDAAEALRPLAGNGARILLALGLIGSGFLTVPILTGSSAYALASTFHWKEGLDYRPSQAKHFYLVIGISTLLAMQLNFMGINPVSALFWAAVINGLLAPPLLVIIMVVASSKKIMGKWVNGLATNVLGWACVALMLATEIALLIAWAKA